MRREPWGPASWQDRPEPPPFSPGDQLLGYGVTAAGVAGGLVWATGQVAGMAFGHTWLHVDPAELAGVLVHLREHLGDPQLAWPADAQQALPGPVGMYATFTATTAAAGAATGQVLRLVGAGDRPRLGRPAGRPGSGPRPGPDAPSCGGCWSATPSRAGWSWAAPAD